MLNSERLGIAEPQLVRLIQSRCRRFKLDEHESEDLQQQILMKVSDPRFDPTSASDVSPVTIITCVIDRQVKSYIRGKQRYRQRLARYQDRSGVLKHDGTSLSEPAAPDEPVDLRMDVDAAMKGLRQRDHTVCKALAEGRSIREIAMQLGCTRATVGLSVSRIRDRFVAAGLKVWVSA